MSALYGVGCVASIPALACGSLTICKGITAMNWDPNNPNDPENRKPRPKPTVPPKSIK